MPDELLTVPEAAKLIGITTRGVRDRIRQRTIKFQIIDGHYRIAVEDCTPGRRPTGRRVKEQSK